MIVFLNYHNEKEKIATWKQPAEMPICSKGEQCQRIDFTIQRQKEYTDLMSISEMEEFMKHIKLLPPTQLNIVSSTGTIDGKTDSGWKEDV